MNQKRSFNPKWQKDDSDLEDDSHEFEEEELPEFVELKGLLKELLEVCKKLNGKLQEVVKQ